MRADGSLSPCVLTSGGLTIDCVLWGQARKLHSFVLNALGSHDEQQLRDLLVHDERQLARLNSCSGLVAGRWLSMFPASWWPKFEDSYYIMALRFRRGLILAPAGQKCMHVKVKDRQVRCEQCMDGFGDHAVSCSFGGHLFTRHGAINCVVAEAGRVAGYTAYSEQVVPELCQVVVQTGGVVKIREARVDVELFGHAYAPNYLVDGTVKHPAASTYVHRASQDVGYTAEEGVKAKAKRYPPARGKSVIACSMETWGRASEFFDALLIDLAALASRRQRERGMQQTKWLAKWRTQLSLSLAIHVGRALFDSLGQQHQREFFSKQVSPQFNGADVLDERSALDEGAGGESMVGD